MEPADLRRHDVQPELDRPSRALQQRADDAVEALKPARVHDGHRSMTKGALGWRLEGSEHELVVAEVSPSQRVTELSLQIVQPPRHIFLASSSSEGGVDPEPASEAHRATL